MMPSHSIRSQQDHEKLSRQASHKDPLVRKEYWLSLAKEYQWRKFPTQSLEGSFEGGDVRWFSDGHLNITENMLDRHLPLLADHVALHFIPNQEGAERRNITYQELFQSVNRWSKMFQSLDLKANDVVCLYMPHIPELAFAMLACARLGLVHSVVFGGFSAQALRSRIIDAECKLVVTCDGSYRGDKYVDYKNIVDVALTSLSESESESENEIENKILSKVKHVLIHDHTKKPISLVKGRDLLISEELKKIPMDTVVKAVDRKAEDPLFILYTSGSTGKPKGLLHTTGGYMVWAGWTMREVFQLRNDSLFWCTADAGWITGHSYVIYGPLLNGITSVMYEGIPTYPSADRFWKIIEELKVTHFYTAPTAIRGLESLGDEFPKHYAMDSLQVCGSVGEPINLEAWEWLKKWVAKERCPIVDTWWQTETGGIMITNVAGITPEIPTKATLPLPGVQAILLDEKGNQATREGTLCLSHPWPGMARTIYGDHTRYRENYFKAYPGFYFTGDAAECNERGEYRILGRMDDVINVSGHRIGTAEVENVINESHFIVESAVVGAPHDIKGECLWAFAVYQQHEGVSIMKPIQELLIEVNQLLTKQIGAIAKLDRLIMVPQLPKTRSGKIMRRFLRKLSQGEKDLKKLGDVSTLTNPEIIEEISKLI
ncbi:MAG: acetate--CoA ligase [Bacteriovoracaceae bacterium]|nr:acetate--CoA ligase [Bacteriovoracaceae bacterium]